MQSSIAHPRVRISSEASCRNSHGGFPSSITRIRASSLRSFVSPHAETSHGSQPTRLLHTKPIKSPTATHFETSRPSRLIFRRSNGSSSLQCSYSAENWDAAPEPDEASPSKAVVGVSKGWVESMGEAMSMGLPVWVTLSCAIALAKPVAFSWVTPRMTVLFLTIVMLGMGMTLTLDDLRGAFSMTKGLIVGFVLQYTVMPLSGFYISKLLGLPSHYAAGIILVACCPGGTASNVVTYIARGNVALSVLMTATSTILAVVMTPFLTAKFAGQYVPVSAKGLVISTMQVVLLPVLGGAFLNQYFQGLVKYISPLMPPIAVATVAMLAGTSIAQSSSAIAVSGAQILTASSLLHASGFCFGYLLSRVFGIDVAASRTISIEVGMQNTSLGIILATQHFGNPLTAVPCAVSGFCQSIFGSALAALWRSSLPEKSQSRRKMGTE